MLSAIRFGPSIGALDNTARAAGMVVKFFAQTFLVPFKDGLPACFGRTFKTPIGEITGGLAASLVHNIDQDSRTVCI